MHREQQGRRYFFSNTKAGKNLYFE
uniref:Uncharacterized protein n=1 Tax=Anguilla anguilla TaxID=7936 RepID=A0A0E9XMV1_ANGAN